LSRICGVCVGWSYSSAYSSACWWAYSLGYRGRISWGIGGCVGRSNWSACWLVVLVGVGVGLLARTIDADLIRGCNTEADSRCAPFTGTSRRPVLSTGKHVEEQQSRFRDRFDRPPTHRGVASSGPENRTNGTTDPETDRQCSAKGFEDVAAGAVAKRETS